MAGRNLYVYIRRIVKKTGAANKNAQESKEYYAEQTGGDV